MALLERQLAKMLKRNDIEFILLPDFTQLFYLAQQIATQANIDSGKSTTFIFGFSENEKIVGIKGNEAKIKNQLHTFMSIFKPSIKYKLESRFNPSDYSLIYYLHIYPSLKRFFYPHKIRNSIIPLLSALTMDDFNSKLEDILSNNASQILPFNTLINSFSPSHIEQFYQFKGESKSTKLNRIVDRIHFFESREQLERAIEVIGLDALLMHDISLFALKCSGRILSLLELEDELSKEIVISRLQHLFSLLPEGKEELQKHVIYFIRDILIGDDSIFGIDILSYSDLIILLQVLSAIGIQVNLDHVIKAIEFRDMIRDKIKHIKDQDRPLWEDELLAKIFVIFAPYFENTETTVKSIFKFRFRKKKTNKSKLKKLIEERDKVFRPIKSNGRHERDNKLAFLVKEYYDFECQSCDSKKSSITTITISHKIPLYFGVEFGGVDRSWNMEVLCRFCHTNYEKGFDKMVFDNVDVVSKENLIEFLKLKFPKNFQ